MSNRPPLSLGSKLSVIGLVVAAAGISTLFATNSVAVLPDPDLDHESVARWAFYSLV